MSPFIRITQCWPGTVVPGMKHTPVVGRMAQQGSLSDFYMHIQQRGAPKRSRMSSWEVVGLPESHGRLLALDV